MRCISIAAVSLLLIAVAAMPILAKTVIVAGSQQNSFAPDIAKFSLTPVHFLARRPLAFGPFIVKPLSPQELRELAEEKQRRQQILFFGPAQHIREVRAAHHHKPRH